MTTQNCHHTLPHSLSRSPPHPAPSYVLAQSSEERCINDQFHLWIKLWWRCCVCGNLCMMGRWDEKSNKTSESYWMSFNKSLHTYTPPSNVCRVSFPFKSIISHQSSPAWNLYLWVCLPFYVCSFENLPLFVYTSGHKQFFHHFSQRANTFFMLSVAEAVRRNKTKEWVKNHVRW